MIDLVIDSKRLYGSFLYGAYYVVKNANELNDINYFPIPDGDTGTNLSSLMESIINKSSLKKEVDETLLSISEAALIGSKGNSGLIFSQFIYGFAKNISKTDTLISEQFIEAMNQAYLSSYQAILKPVEGTMITVIRAFTQELDKTYKATFNLKKSLDHAFDALKKELFKTKEKLKEFKKLPIEDAGAKGFYYFIEGFLSVFFEDEINLEPVRTLEKFVALEFNEVKDHDIDVTERYCTEVLIKTNMNKHDIYALVKNLGNSLVIGESKSIKRIHIHTNIPSEIILKLEPIGEIIETKVDDMKLQTLATDKKNKVAILTDSIADIPSHILEANNVFVYNLAININNLTYYDKLSVDSDKFYDVMKNGTNYPKSSAPNPLQVQKLYKQLLAANEKILVISVSSKMSSSYDVFYKEALNFKDSIVVVDSLQNSVGEGLVVLEAIRLKNSNLSFDKLVEEVQNYRKKVKVLVYVKTIKYMIRSGRLKKSIGLVANMIRLKPIISIDENGSAQMFKKGIGQLHAQSKIIAYIKKLYKENNFEGYAVVHAKNEKKALKITEKIKKITNTEPLYISDISSIIAMNSGIGSVGIGVIRKV